jgi:hypothetical protein
MSKEKKYDIYHVYNDKNQIVKTIIPIKKYCKIKLADAHCPIYNGVHSEKNNYRYFIIADCGYAFMKCTHQKCKTKASPESGGIKLPQEYINDLFSE